MYPLELERDGNCAWMCSIDDDDDDYDKVKNKLNICEKCAPKEDDERDLARRFKKKSTLVNTFNFTTFQ